jgi:hypothetical protein
MSNFILCFTDPDNPKNRIKLTTTNTVTIRNGKYGSQPWLLTTNSAHTLNVLSELTTVRDESDYVTETNTPSDKMITMVLMRFNDSELASSSSTTVPSSTITLNEPKILETDNSNSSTDFNNSAGASAAKEAINTIKVSSTATLNGSTSSSRKLIEARTESTAFLILDSDSSLSEESSEENIMGRTSSEAASSEKSEEMSETESDEISIENNSTVFGSSSTSKILETSSVKLSTSTTPTFHIEKVAVQDIPSCNISKSPSTSELIEGVMMTIQTTVTQINNLSENTSEDSENAEILFVEKGSNLSSILNGVPTSFDDDQSTASIIPNSSPTIVKQVEDDATTFSDNNFSIEATKVEVGSHKNLSLFVDLRRLNGTEVMNDLNTVSTVEATTVIGDEEKRGILIASVANQTNNTTENLEQNVSTTSVFVNASEAETFTTPISNASRENITTLVASVTDVEMTTPSTNVTKDVVQNREADSADTKMTQAFPFTYGQLTSPTNANNHTECSMGIVKRTSPVPDKLNFSTTSVPVSDFTSSVSLADSAITGEGLSSYKITIPDSNSTENFALNTTSSTSIWNVSIITASIQPPDSFAIKKQPVSFYESSTLSGK